VLSAQEFASCVLGFGGGGGGGWGAVLLTGNNLLMFWGALSVCQALWKSLVHQLFGPRQRKRLPPVFSDEETEAWRD
jgi:hypothetical protein